MPSHSTACTHVHLSMECNHMMNTGENDDMVRHMEFVFLVFLLLNFLGLSTLLLFSLLLVTLVFLFSCRSSRRACMQNRFDPRASNSEMNCMRV